MSLNRGNTRRLIELDSEGGGFAESVPSWVVSVLKYTSPLNRPLGKVLLTVLECCMFAYGAYGVTDAVQAAGFVETRGCAVRASLWFVVASVTYPIDFMIMLYTTPKDLPNIWTSHTKQTMQAAHKSLKELPAAFVVLLILSTVPTCLWLRDGLSIFAPALCVLVVGLLGHMLCNATTFQFIAVHSELSQVQLTRKVITGTLTYEEAVSAYMVVNKERKAVARALSNAALTFALMFLYQAVILYDFEIRPWSGWPFAVIYIANTLALVLTMSPWLVLNDWPDELIAEMYESGELAWSPAEKSNFAALVGGTKVKISILDFEMSHGFRMALPLLFFGWWLYMTELKQFHHFQGFPFDQICFNATEGDEHDPE